ncbi:MAG: hypothetical protein JST38_18430 [Bacteroidetes bacterium]|nr:hypothetical protein [Bacteroidota bacterium]
MNAEATTQKQYLAALEQFATVRPLVGRHSIGNLVIDITMNTWCVRAEDGRGGFRAEGRHKSAEQARCKVAKAIKEYAELYHRI